MGYMHIDNLYKDTRLLDLFKELWALEKIHGTSAHISFRDGKVHYFPGGFKYELFIRIFDQEQIYENFIQLGRDPIIIFGEQYGGKQQRMGTTYGEESRFVAFDVRIGDTWLNVENAYDVVSKMGLEFVHFVKIPATKEALDAERNADSIQAIRNGVGPGKKREGIVIRPLIELQDTTGSRLIAKHKRDDFSEIRTPKKLGDPFEIVRGQKAALEWATEMRLSHVLDKLVAAGVELQIEKIPIVIGAMLEDIEREGENEIIMDKTTKKAISAATVKMYKKWLDSRI